MTCALLEFLCPYGISLELPTCFLMARRGGLYEAISRHKYGIVGKKDRISENHLSNCVFMKHPSVKCNFDDVTAQYWAFLAQNI
jgi:hypothetical protein